MKISVPALRNELFVNILGYKEPNLVRLNQCRGFCGAPGSPVACMATKMRQKKVSMMFKTNSSGRDSKEQSHELILDEHVECGCQCAPQARYRCAGQFNEHTCECDCDERRYWQKKFACESEPNTFWDRDECSCNRKSVVPRGIDTRDAPCRGNVQTELQTFSFHSFIYVFLGCFITLSIFLSAATLHYRKKFLTLKQLKSHPEKKPVNMTKHKCMKDENTRSRRHQRHTYGKEMKLQHSSPEDFPHKMYHQHLPNYVDRYSPHLDTDSGQERYKQEHGVNIHQ